MHCIEVVSLFYLKAKIVILQNSFSLYVMNTVFFPILLVDSILFLSFITSKLLPLYDIAEDIASILTISSGPDGTGTHDPKVVRPE